MNPLPLDASPVEHLRQLLTEALQPSHLDIVDDSARHRGHSGAAAGGGHFNVIAVAEVFADRPPTARHRLVYNAVSELMPHRVHALSLKLFTPAEWHARG